MAENVPLLSHPRSNKYSGDEASAELGYLLLSVPSNEKKFLHKKCIDIVNYSGIIVGVSVSVIIFLIILGVSYHADVSELLLQQGSDETLTTSAPLPAETVNAIDRTLDIKTPLGDLRGHLRQSRKKRDYVVFHKVPFALPPIGSLRFKDPQPVDEWQGIRDYKEAGPSCVQKSKHIKENVASGEEDCLYSSIFVPNPGANEVDNRTYPVMVYIHGGGFSDGNGSKYGAEYFMDEDVILVIFEYRLGLLGFLNTGDREATGNMGLKDQVMMLRFTKKYIRYFNGNDDDITIFGNSMGGFSVSFLVISPMSKGLFHRAISQSGTVLCESPTLLDLKPEVTKEAVAKVFNCSLQSSATLLACLRSVDVNELALLKHPDVKYALTVEHGFDKNNLSDVFMPEKPYDLLKAGKVNPVQYIMGVVSSEWISITLMLLQNDKFIQDINANFSTKMPEILGLNLTTEETQAIKSFYFDDKPINNESERSLTNLLSDRLMVHATKVTADFHSLVNDTYLYYLSKRPAKSYADKLLASFPVALNTTNSVSHADEVQYLFPYSGYPEYTPLDEEYFPFSEYLVKLWANFATSGIPTIDPSTQDWVATTSNLNGSSQSFWYELNDRTGRTMALDERMQFWDKFSHKKMMYEQ